MAATGSWPVWFARLSVFTLSCLILPAACSLDLPETADRHEGDPVTRNAGLVDWTWARLEEPAVLTIGNDDGASAYRFDGIVDAVFRRDGTIVVADEGSREIRWFAADGSLLATAGRSGEGPGEFRSLDAIGLAGPASLDVWAYDRRLRRFTFFNVGGDVTGDVSLAGAASTLYGPHRFSDGSFAMSAGTSSRPGPGVGSVTWRDTTPVLRVGPAGMVSETLLVVAAGSFRRLEGPDGPTLGVPPLPRLRRMISEGNRLHVTTQERFEVRTYSADGVLLRVLTAVVPGAQEALERYTRYTENSPSEAVPATGRLLVDHDHDLWIGDPSSVFDFSRGWTVFDSTGRPLGRVEMPEDFRLLDARGDRVLGVARDELGVERIRVHRRRILQSGG